MLDIAEAASDLEDFNVLLDTRKLSGMLTGAELWHLAEKFVNHPHIGRRKTAVLCPEFRLDHSRFFALRAERQGGNVQAFSSYEEAMDWLLVANLEKTVRRPSTRRLPGGRSGLYSPQTPVGTPFQAR